MMKLCKMVLTVIAVGWMVSGCASITRGTKEVFIIKTKPNGANVAMSNGATCTSPCSEKLKRKHGFHISITKNQFHTVETEVNTEVARGGSRGMAGNILLGGGIGAIVDASNGSMNKFVPNPLVVPLTPLKAGEMAEPPVVKPGESFDYKTFKKTGTKNPLKDRERRS